MFFFQPRTIPSNDIQPPRIHPNQSFHPPRHWRDEGTSEMNQFTAFCRNGKDMFLFEKLHKREEKGKKKRKENSVVGEI